jgi:hypothetical protein
LPLASVGSAVNDSLSLKLLPSGMPALEVSNFTVVGSLHDDSPWRILDTRTALRVVVRSTDRLIDHRSPFGAHDTHGSDDRPKSPPLAGVPPAQMLKCGTERAKVRPPSWLTAATRPCAPPSDQRSCCHMPATSMALLGRIANHGSTSASS